MRLVKTAEGKSKLKLTKTEWEKIGQDAGWIKTADIMAVPQGTESDYTAYSEIGGFLAALVSGGRLSLEEIPGSVRAEVQQALQGLQSMNQQPAEQQPAMASGDKPAK